MLVDVTEASNRKYIYFLSEDYDATQTIANAAFFVAI
jgi:hypothetical protein